MFGNRVTSRNKFKLSLYYYLPLSIILDFSLMKYFHDNDPLLFVLELGVCYIVVLFLSGLYFLFFNIIIFWIEFVLQKKYTDTYIEFDGDYISSKKNNIYKITGISDYYNIGEQIEDRAFYLSFAIFVVLISWLDNGSFLWGIGGLFEQS
jgi:hypothetical protein